MTEHRRLQLAAELWSRVFEGSDAAIELLLRSGSIPSGAGLRVFYRDHLLQEDDK